MRLSLRQAKAAAEALDKMSIVRRIRALQDLSEWVSGDLAPYGFLGELAEMENPSPENPRPWDLPTKPSVKRAPSDRVVPQHLSSKE